MMDKSGSLVSRGVDKTKDHHLSVTRAAADWQVLYYFFPSPLLPPKLGVDSLKSLL